MNIYIYSDESGVLDKVHNKFFAFAGLFFYPKKIVMCALANT